MRVMPGVFQVSDDCLKLGLRAGAIVFQGVRVEAASVALQSEIAREIEAIRAHLPASQNVRHLPEVRAFRDLLRRVGVNAKKEQPSIERLLGFALKRGTLPAINSLVDAYNLISIHTRCS